MVYSEMNVSAENNGDTFNCSHHGLGGHLEPSNEKVKALRNTFDLTMLSFPEKTSFQSKSPDSCLYVDSSVSMLGVPSIPSIDAAFADIESSSIQSRRRFRLRPRPTRESPTLLSKKVRSTLFTTWDVDTHKSDPTSVHNELPVVPHIQADRDESRIKFEPHLSVMFSPVAPDQKSSQAVVPLARPVALRSGLKHRGQGRPPDHKTRHTHTASSVAFTVSSCCAFAKQSK